MRIRILFFLFCCYLLQFGKACAVEEDSLRLINMKATYYADRFVGRKTSNGEIFSHDKLTAAHKTIKLGTYVKVTNPKNGNSIIVKVNDRCPKVGILDMTRRGLAELGIKGAGQVVVQILEGTDYPEQMAAADTHYDEAAAASKKSKTTKNKKSSKAKTQKTSHAVQAKTTKTNSAVHDRRPSSQPPETAAKAGSLYDIELNTVRSLNAADAELSLLPSEYINSVRMVREGKNFRIVLSLGMKRNDVERILDDLILSFPRAVIINH